MFYFLFSISYYKCKLFFSNFVPMGRKVKPRSKMTKEGKKQTMKQLTKKHGELAKTRTRARQEPNPNAKQDLEDLISTTVRPPKK